MQLPLEGGDERRREGSGCPLTGSNGHRLSTVDSRLDVECVPMVFCSIGVELATSLLFLWANERQKRLFSEFLYVLVFVTCKTCLHQNLWRV
jgi:hypothetical protein